MFCVSAMAASPFARLTRARLRLHLRERHVVGGVGVSDILLRRVGSRRRLCAARPASTASQLDAIDETLVSTK